MTDEGQQVALDALEDACEKVQPPLYRLEQGLHPWVTLLIMPVFALANAGVVLGGELTKHISEPVTLGVVWGLLLGKPIGIGLASWLAVRIRLAMLPVGSQLEPHSWSRLARGDRVHNVPVYCGIGVPQSGTAQDGEIRNTSGIVVRGDYRLHDPVTPRAG